MEEMPITYKELRAKLLVAETKGITLCRQLLNKRHRNEADVVIAAGMSFAFGIIVAIFALWVKGCV